MENTQETAGQGNWIKLSREILDWEWYSEPNTFRVFVDLLLNAQYKDSRYRGNEIKRGQLITSVDAICKRTGLSIQNVRTALANLEETGEINKQTNKRVTLITICKYDTYQGESEEGNKQTNKRVTNNQQTSNNIQEVNKERNKEGLQLASQVSSAEKLAEDNSFMKEKEVNSLPEENSSSVDKKEIPFTKSDLYNLVKVNFNGKIDSNKYYFINGCYDKIASQNFVYNSGKECTLDNLSEYIVNSFNKTTVSDPFTKEELLSKISTERQEVIDVLLQKYDSFKKSGWKTSKGTDVDITFFTGYLLKQTKEALGVSKLPDYNKMDLKNFWK